MSFIISVINPIEPRSLPWQCYSVHFFCDECSDVHPIGIRVSLDDGPVEKSNINDAYAGKEVDPMVLSMSNNVMTCPNTGKPTVQTDNNQIFLVPVG